VEQLPLADTQLVVKILLEEGMGKLKARQHAMVQPHLRLFTDQAVAFLQFP